MLKRQLFILPIIALLFGCGIDEGWVYEKQHVPLRIIPVYNASLKMTIMTTFPEHWIIRIRDEEDIGSCRVSRRAFENIRLDQYFVCP